MIYQTTSAREVMARVVRNTRVQDSSYILDMDEWIPEALAQMNLKMATETTYEDLQVHFHKAKMPACLHSALAVEYNGKNLLTSNSIRVQGAPTTAPRNKTRMVDANQQQFISVPQTYQVNHGDGTTGQIFDSSAVPAFCSQSTANCVKLHPCHGDWYQIEVPGYITTSFKSGWIRLHFKKVPIDSDGLPLIPDNENLKQAIYWYCRGMMQGAGWVDPVYKNIEQLLGPGGKFETMARRAISEITYPTDAQLELAVRNGNKLIKDEHYYDRFFETPGNEHRPHRVEVEYSDAGRVVPNMPVSLVPLPGGEIFNETPVGVINGSNKLFTTIHHYVPGTLAVYRNGILQAPGLHYTYNGVSTFTFVAAPLSTPTLDVILVNYTLA